MNLVCLVSCFLWTCCASQSVCEEPPDIDFGEIVSDEKVSYEEHDRIQYRCSPGYTLEGSEWIICSDQKWTLPPKCLAPCSITRQQLDAKNLLISNGQRRSKLIWNNHTIAFMCREGYVITTPSVRKCVDGRMDLPSCISERGKNCSRPPIIKNGDIITLFQKQYPSGSSVEFKCQLYYAMKGQNKSFCDNGIWTEVPACLEPCAITLTENHMLVKGRSHGSEFPTTYLPRGDSLELSCKPGYVLETNPSQSAFLIQCNEEPIVYPKCKEIICNPPQMTNGTFRPQRNVYQGGDLIRIECDPGFQLENGQNIVECTSSGWSPSPQCDKAICPPPPTIPHGYLYGPQKERYLPFEMVRYRCEERWSLFGPQLVTCLNKQWTTLPECREAEGRCDRPPVIQNGDIFEAIKSRYDSNSVVTYKCQALYIMHGRPTVRCFNGHWTEAPKCIGKRTRNTQLSPHSPASPGVDVQGSRTRLLPPSGTAAPCTANEEDLWNHNIQLRWTHSEKLYSLFGDVMEFMCRNGFQPAPSSPPFRVQCREGKLEYPSCTKFCNVNGRAMGNHNIQLKHASETRIPSGDEVEFICRRGFQAASTSSPFHVQCREGNLEYPSCTRMPRQKHF